MGFPNELLVPKPRSDGGIVIQEYGKTITNNKVILNHFARGREILSDGRVISSSIVVTKGGRVYTEVFETPVPEGFYFYHYEDTSPSVNSSVLLFNQNETGVVDVKYETRGDYILASRHNLIEQDLAAVEKLLSINGVGWKAVLTGVIPDTQWTNYTINNGVSVWGKKIDCSAYTSDVTNAIVLITYGFKSSVLTSIPNSPTVAIKGASGMSTSEILIAGTTAPSSFGGYSLNYFIIIP